MYYFYLLQSKIDEDFYYGITADLKERVKEHNKGKVRSTKSRKPLALIYYEAYQSKKDARRRELEVKNKGQQREILKERVKNSLISF